MNGPSRVRIYQRTQVFRQSRSLLLTKNDSAKHILRIIGQGLCTEDTLPAPQVASNPQLFLPLPHHSRFINHSQVLGVVVVDFVHVYLETHCNDCVSRRPFPQHASRIEGKKKKRITHSRIPIIPDPTTPPVLRDRARGRLQRHGNRCGVRSGRASRSRASRTGGIGAAGRAAGPGGGGCERAGLDIHAAEALVLGCGAVVAAAGDGARPNASLRRSVGTCQSMSRRRKGYGGNSSGKKDLRRKPWRRMDQRSW